MYQKAFGNRVKVRAPSQYPKHNLSRAYIFSDSTGIGKTPSTLAFHSLIMKRVKRKHMLMNFWSFVSLAFFVLPALDVC